MKRIVTVLTMLTMLTGCGTQKGGEFGVRGEAMGYYATIKGVVEVGKVEVVAVVTNAPPVVTNAPSGDVPEYVSVPKVMVMWTDLKQEATITACTFDGSKLSLAWAYSTPWTGKGDESCDGVVCFYAKGRAAYVDYKPIGTGYSWPAIGENLRNGHGDLGLKSGDKIGFFICGTVDPKQRSDIFWTVIP